jgi:hypothetical protein
MFPTAGLWLCSGPSFTNGSLAGVVEIDRTSTLLAGCPVTTMPSYNLDKESQ